MKEYDGKAYWQLNDCPRCQGRHPRNCPDCWSDHPTCGDVECSWPEADDE